MIFIVNINLEGSSYKSFRNVKDVKNKEKEGKRYES